MSDAGADSTVEGSVISLPKGGGAVSGVGEKFSPDLFTGTGNFSVPIAVPPGRRGMQPRLTLTYSTGNGNGPFGLGWQLSVPGVSRKTSRGLPRYTDGPAPEAGQADTFVLSGAEDLVPVAGAYPGRVRYRPRTEGLFARIEHVRDDTGDFWEVRSKDGLLTRYGTPGSADAGAGWRDPAVLADPAGPGRIFGWRITQTQDPLGNLVRYDYLPDRGTEGTHAWDHPLLARISYADYGDRGNPSFLVTVDFEYEPRPDAFSDYRAGFELRTTRRCRMIRVSTHAADGIERVAREYRCGYEQAAFNGVSLLTRVDAVGIDVQAQPPEEPLPPLTFAYSGFDPAGRRFQPLTGPGLPTAPLSDATLALVDLRGLGLPDLVELGAVRRYWRNAGDGRFELPRLMDEAPPYSLGEPGVQFLDADGDGRPDLVVPSPSPGSRAPVAGYFPMTFAAGWSRRSFRPYSRAPGVSLGDPSVKLIDLDGDGLTDVLHSGTRLECWFNDPDPRRAWQRTAVSNGSGPGIDLADPRVRLADMTGDGLHDIVLLRSGNIAYWPNLGYGRWGAMVTMRRAPRLPDGYDPRRVLLGDLDGDGAADLVYVDDGRVLLWGNQCGNAWTEQPVTITGTPDVVGTDAVQLADLHGTGMAGLLYSRAADGSGRPHLRFLDLTGGVKPHLLTEMDNHLGALTRVTYQPSTAEYLRDQAQAASRWRTTLPFPVHVVARVEVTDAISGGRLTTEYRYHHGYWDGVEREFGGFAMVEQFDTETFDRAPASGPGAVSADHYSPPTLTKNWFHPGPVAAVEAGDWAELDLSHEYWNGDGPMLTRPPELTAFLGSLPRSARRAALRTLRGQLLRGELYALDATDRQDRPYTVTESISGIREEAPPAGPPDDVRERIFFPFVLGQRTTQWERGDDPMTRFTFPTGFDEYGFPTQQVAIAVPRGRDPLAPGTGTSQPYLATYATTGYARRDDTGHYLVNRVSRTTSYEIVNDGTATVAQLRDAVLAGPPAGGSGVSLRMTGHTRTFYDGDAFAGLPAGELGEHGLPVRTETLAFTDGFLDALYDPADPLAVGSRPGYLTPGTVSWTGEYPREFRDRLPQLAGYIHYADGEVPGSPAGFYIAAARHRYDAHDPARAPRGLPLSSLDPLGSETRTDYDEHDLLSAGTTDAAGLQTSAVNDYRVLQPRELTDPNGNTSAVTFSPAGLVTAGFVRGKDGEGDRDQPSTRMAYDLLAFAERGQPASVSTVRRVHHDSQVNVPAGQRDEVLVSVGYCDGFGRILQTRAQAEDTLFGDPAFGGNVITTDQSAPTGDTVGRTRAPGVPDNVIVSGWQIYDNKGRVVHKYEPFFSTGFDYAAPLEAQLGQKATMFYDPRGQVLRTLNPNGSEQRVVFGVPGDLTGPEAYSPTPWESFTYDANDNAGRTHPAEAQPYASHWNTPASIEVDALGRTVRVVARNGSTEQASTAWFTTRTAYDIQGNIVSISDSLRREAFRYSFDLAKRRWRMDSIDAGRRDTVPDALGNPIENRDSKGAVTLCAFDLLHRPTRTWARDDATTAVTLRQRIDYGDAGDPGQPPAERDAARAGNLLGRQSRHHDEAGLTTVALVDFKGNVLDRSRRVIADEPMLAVVKQAASNGWQVTPFRVDWQPGIQQDLDGLEDALLESVGYQTTAAYDALNRIERAQFPQDVEGRRRELRPEYNRAGSLDRVWLDGTLYVERIAYDAKGQRALIAYGNGVMTRYAYDPHTFRLARLRSEPYIQPDSATYQPAGAVLQDYGYEYDLIGNILRIIDRTPGSGIPRNPAAFGNVGQSLGQLLINGDALDRSFDYDPLYRLLSASGRECDLPPDQPPWQDAPRGTDLTKARAYTEHYTYDEAHNLLRLDHRNEPGGFTRAFAVEPADNRLRTITAGSITYGYRFDGNGNLLSEATSRHFAWGHRDHLTVFRTQTGAAEPSVYAQYLYDAHGQRVKKLVRKQGGQIEVTHYLGGVFEHHRWGNGATAGTNNNLHILGDGQRIALVRLGPAHPRDTGPTVQFHLADHLGSSNAVVDDTGALTNREEFSPYGETTFGSFTRKRYRFTGAERDEESGLAYHCARFYAPGTARWLSCDPIGAAAGANPYTYARGNPIRFTDPGGADAATEDHPALEAQYVTLNRDDVFASFDTNRNGKLDATEVWQGFQCTNRGVANKFLANELINNFEKGGWEARTLLLQPYFQDQGIVVSHTSRVHLYDEFNGPSQSTREQHEAALDRIHQAALRGPIEWGELVSSMALEPSAEGAAEAVGTPRDAPTSANEPSREPMPAPDPPGVGGPPSPTQPGGGTGGGGHPEEGWAEVIEVAADPILEAQPRGRVGRLRRAMAQQQRGTTVELARLVQSQLARLVRIRPDLQALLDTVNEAICNLHGPLQPHPARLPEWLIRMRQSFNEARQNVDIWGESPHPEY